MLDERTERLARRMARRPVVAGFAALLGTLAATPGEAAEEGRRKKCRSADEQTVKRHIRRAAKKYNQRYEAMLCVARCESNLDNCAVNKAGKSYGLFQFIRSTWDSTPFKDKNIYSAKWNAMATGWMWKQGRQNEWVCCDNRYGCNCRG